MKGRDFVVPEDVDYVFGDVCCHRMVFNNSPLDDENSKEVIKEILNSVTINI